MFNSSDRREAIRIPLKAKICAHFVAASESPNGKAEAFRGWTQDVSFGGLRVILRKPPPLNAIVDIELACTRPIETFRLRGQIGWHCRESARSYMVGIFVREPSKERLVGWRRMLERRGLRQ